jgi:phage terminase large subunit
VYKHLLRSSKRITVQQGGTRSGKTYNIILWLIFHYSVNNKGSVITICRKTFPSLRASVMRDFFQILREHNIYLEEFHNKSSNEYHLNGNLVEFISLDQPQKIRGRKRNLLFINEANELYYEDWQQLIFRTEGKVIIDYNPSETFHWIYDKVIPRDDCDFYQTTYLDNPFLNETIVSEIERLKDTDNDYWRIYGLGERGTNRAAVFQYQIVDEVPEDADLVSTGLDFGFTNDPTAIVRIYKKGDNLYVKELLYKTNLTNTDISECLRGLGFSRQDEIWADSAEPKSIEELHRMGWNIKPAVKGADSVMAGIDVLKRHRIHLMRSDLNVIKEFQNYKWMDDKNGNLLNRPVDAFNHAIDATRYATFNRLSRPNYGRYAIR